MKLPLVGQSFSLPSLAAAAQASMNWYPEVIDDPNERGKTKAILRPTPGYHRFDQGAIGGPICGMWSGGGRLFIITQAPDNSVSEINAGGYIVSGHIPYGATIANHPAQIFSNGTQLAYIAGGKVYYDNGAGPVLATFTGGTDPVTAVTGAFLDGQLYVQRPSGGSPDLGKQVTFSAVNDFSSWAGLDFFTKEGYPDYIQSILADKEQLYVFGTESGEIWQNDPSTGRPVRISGAMIREGSAARYAPVSMNNKVFFLGGSPRGQCSAYSLNGFTPVRISTHAVEAAWRGSDPTTAVAYAYLEDGHWFWVINFSSDLNTWVYDETASQEFGSPMWHQRAHFNPASGGSFENYRLWYHAFIPEWGGAGVHIVADPVDAKLYIMSSDFSDDDGADSRRQRALPYLYNGGNKMYLGRMTLETDTGDQISTTVEETITLDYSDDRGHTFVNPKTAGMGLHDDHSRRVVWFGNGSTRGRVNRLTYTGQLPVTLIDLECEITQGVV